MYSINGLKKSFAIDGKKIEVLKGLDLDIAPEEITVILGKSGCGKTTLLRILSGLEPYDEGTVCFPEKGKTGMAFQDPALMPWLTVHDNITFGLKKSKTDEKKVSELIETVGLSGFENAYPSQLSGGMKHRVSLARTLVRDPELLLLDEPFAALDYFIRESMQNELLRIHRETGMGGIFVTHNIDEAIILGDRICIMKDGVISQVFSQNVDGSHRDLLSSGSVALKHDILEGLK